MPPLEPPNAHGAVHDVELGSPTQSDEPSPAFLHAQEAQQRLGEATQAAVGSLKSMSKREQLLALAVCSMVELIMAAQIYYDRPITAYEISLGAVSMTICALLVGKDVRGQPLDDDKHAKATAFLFAWWLAGVVVATFFGDFSTLAYANGFFFTWLSFIVSAVMYFNVSSFAQVAGASLSDKLSSNKYASLLFALVIASAVSVGSAIRPCHTGCSGLVGFALAVGIVSLLQTAVLLALGARVSNATMRGNALFLVAWWSAGAGTATFNTPFVAASNGYFAAVAALFCSVGLLRLAIHDE